MNKVRELREQRGLTQVALAKKIHIAQSNLSAIENGRVTPWPKAKRSLARVLKTTIAELFPSNGGGRVS